jgi:two-component system cell cycle response regulator CtrA
MINEVSADCAIARSAEGVPASRVVAIDPARHGITAYDLVREFRREGMEPTVVILAGVPGTSFALDEGADRILARLGAPVSAPKPLRAPIVRLGRLTVDTDARAVKVDGVQVRLTLKEYQILELLALRKGATVSKEELLAHLYGSGKVPHRKIIDVFVSKLRRKLAAATGGGSQIETLWGMGYCLRDLSDADAPRPRAARKVARLG